jgi:RNA polymerase sigma-70 factor (ECF subfamily)
MSTQIQIDYGKLTDLDLARCIAARDGGAVRLVTQRNNQRLFRVAWSILKNRAEAEDAVQNGYLKGFAAIASFHGASALSTWLTRIVINEALEQRRRQDRRARLESGSLVVMEEYRSRLMQGSETAAPDQTLAREQIRRLLEEAIARLPEDFRLAFVLREIEGCSLEEAAAALGVPPGTVKTRHFRARRRLQNDLDPHLRTALQGTFPFAGVDCQALTDRVLGEFLR